MNVPDLRRVLLSVLERRDDDTRLCVRLNDETPHACVLGIGIVAHPVYDVPVALLLTGEYPVGESVTVREALNLLSVLNTCKVLASQGGATTRHIIPYYDTGDDFVSLYTYS